MTVGELKEILENMDSDLEVVFEERNGIKHDVKWVVEDIDLIYLTEAR
jgi:uncharacterized protein YoxC